MAYEQKDNTGSLFKNDRKATDTHPDYNGSAKIGGIDYWINAWLKEGQNGGKKFFSFSFKPKEAPKAEPPPARQPARMADGAPAQSLYEDLDDEIPF